MEITTAPFSFWIYGICLQQNMQSKNVRQINMQYNYYNTQYEKLYVKLYAKLYSSYAQYVSYMQNNILQYAKMQLICKNSKKMHLFIGKTEFYCKCAKYAK